MALTNLEQLQQKYNNQCVQSKKTAQQETSFALQYTFEGLQFEATNKVSQDDVAKIVQGTTVKGYTEREVQEIINHFTAFVKVLNAANCQKGLDENFVKDIHEVLTSGIINGGVYRNVNIQIPTAPHQPPDYLKIFDKMNHYFEKVNSLSDPLERAAYAHCSLAKIHPFLDANGRLARLMMNFVLVKAGYLPISFNNKQRQQYFDALEIYKDKKGVGEFAKLIETCLEQRYETALKALK